MALLLEKSLDLDNSSLMLRALMYIASLRTFGPTKSDFSACTKRGLRT
jgi:hypothetical protein